MEAQHDDVNLVFSALACIVVGFYKKASAGDIEAALCVMKPSAPKEEELVAQH